MALFDFFDAFLDFVGFFLVTVAVPYTKIEMLNASFDMTFDPPSYRLNISIPRIGGLMRVTVIAGTL